MVKLFAAMVAENYVDASAPASVDFKVAPSSDYWLTQIDYGNVGSVDKIVSEAMGKAREAAKRAATSPIPIAS